ncbi:MAG: ComEC/Rec2 family competence protein [bacterium]|nr:ComEC/Rec2 family competence protein [bacterium]
MREKILLICIAGFGAGTMSRSFFDIPYVYAFFVVALGCFLFLFWRVRNNALFFFVGLFLVGTSIGIIRFDVKDKGGADPRWEVFAGTSVMLRGTIIEEPDERERYTRLIVDGSELFDWAKKEWKAMPPEKILVTANHYPSFSYGDIVEVRGDIRRPENFEDSGFDWEGYLAKDEIYLEVSYPKVQFIEHGGFFLKRWLFSLKGAYLENIQILLPEPHASFLGGLTVGARRAIPEDLLDRFRAVGVIHIVVLSGYNVTIIARALAGVLGFFLPWMVSVFAGVLGIILFAILTGGAAPVVRASIMAILIYTAQATGRVNRVIIALLIAGAGMIFMNPKILRFDASFQLSFLATLGLIYLAPRFEKRLSWIPKRFGLREAATATLSAQLAVTPLILSLMGTFSIVALPVNMFVLIAVPYAMFFGALAGMLGFISHTIAFPFAWIAYLLLEYQLKIVELFSSLPFAEFSIPEFPVIVMIFLYVMMGWHVRR